MAGVLTSGGVGVIPTDTVYGLAATIFREDALARIYRLKQRESEKQVPLLVASAADLALVTDSVPRAAWPLIARFWPGALTLVFRAHPAVPTILRGESGTIAVRVPAARSCLQLLQAVGEPVVGTSANLAGQAPAATASAAAEVFGSRIDAVLEDDPAPRGTPSTVAEVTDTGCLVHRVGAVPVEALRSVLGVRVELRR